MKWHEAENADSELVRHALRELEGIGYGPHIDDPFEKAMVGSILKIVYIFSQLGHSGYSASYMRGVIHKLLGFENLAEITNKPDDWIEVGHDMWQNRRNGKLFSADGGKHYWDVGDNQRRIHTAEEYIGGRQSEE